jgi:cell division protein FtsX
MNNISNQVRAKVVGYVLAAFGLVAGLAWNDAVKSSIDRFFPLDQGNVIIKFAYALAITIVVVVIGWVLSRDEK